MCNKYCNKINKKIDFLIIEDDKSKKFGEIDYYKLAPNIVRYCVRTNSEPHTVIGNTSGVNKILSQYSIQQPFKIFRKIKNNMYRYIYFCGIKVFTYKKSK